MAVVFAVSVPATAFAMPWSWDMHDQISVKAQESPQIAAPAGTVPSEGHPFFSVKTKEEAGNLPNPMFPTDGSLERGKVLYNIYCTVCHGEAGRGDGKVGKKYMSPTNLTSDYIKKLPDGSIYFVITRGGLGKDDKMPGHGDAILPEDRWHIVNYIKNVLFWQQ
ncbi:MAG: c-type cytochrome [Deltaproteobacteria bacterium]|nr:c-type cytochrome [Deltaproteobacteria bacterium]